MSSTNDFFSTNASINKMLAEAYEQVKKKQVNETHKCPCGCEKCGPGCPCDKNCKCKEKGCGEESLKEGKKKAKPDYMDVDDDGDTDEPMKKAVKEKNKKK